MTTAAEQVGQSVVQYFDLDYMVRMLVELCQTPSPTGLAEPALKLVERELQGLGLATSRTRKGALLAHVPGRTLEAPRVLSAHVDTLGAMVKGIKESGRIWLTQIGGYAWATIEGEYCLVHTHDGRTIPGTILTTHASAHVHGQELTRIERNQSTIEVRLDARTSSREETERLGIAVGDYVSFDARPQVTEAGYIKSRHLDDKAGVAALLGLAQALQRGGLVPAHPTHLFIVNYEEVGHGAAAGIPADTAEFGADLGRARRHHLRQGQQRPVRSPAELAHAPPGRRRGHPTPRGHLSLLQLRRERGLARRRRVPRRAGWPRGGRLTLLGAHAPRRAGSDGAPAAGIRARRGRDRRMITTPTRAHVHGAGAALPIEHLAGVVQVGTGHHFSTTPSRQA